jgi:hypothetical protein
MTAGMVQVRLLSLLLAGFLVTAIPAWAGHGFLNEIEDLPLPQGLTEATGGMLFDTADGRIVEALATGDIDPPQVRRFYDETLPELGWRALGGLSFRRDKEILRIAIEEKHHPVVVRFSLAPHDSDK